MKKSTYINTILNNKSNIKKVKLKQYKTITNNKKIKYHSLSQMSKKTEMQKE